MAPLSPSSPTPSQASVSTKSHSSPSFRDKSPQRRRSEQQENSRIMDPTYFAGTSGIFNHGYPCFVDTEGHLHDIDYAPFPRISPTSNSHFGDGGFQTPPDLKRARASSPLRSSARVPYWETFRPAQHSDEEDPAASSKNIPTSFDAAERQACVYQSYAEHSDQCKSSLRLRFERATRSSSAKAFADVEDEDGEGDDGDDDNQRESHMVTGDKERRRESRPTETLKTTWAKAKFAAHLKFIRAQRRLEQYIHKKN